MKAQWKFLVGKFGGQKLGRKLRASQIEKELPLKTELTPDYVVPDEDGDPTPCNL